MDRENLHSSEVDRLLLCSESEDDFDELEEDVVHFNNRDNDESLLAGLSNQELEQLLENDVIDLDGTNNDKNVIDSESDDDNNVHDDDVCLDGTDENETVIGDENEPSRGNELEQPLGLVFDFETNFDDESSIANDEDNCIVITVPSHSNEMGQGEPSTSSMYNIGPTTTTNMETKISSTPRPTAKKIDTTTTSSRQTKKTSTNKKRKPTSNPENSNKRKKVQKKQKKKKFVDSDWPWLDTNNEPKKIDFTGIPGVNPLYLRRLGNNPTELDAFMQVLGEEFWEMICQETNDYAEKQINNEERRKLKSDERWERVTADEMKVYFALYINMGQIRKPTLKHYWSQRKILETPIFSQTMSFERFTSISRFLHFYDEEYEHDASDKLKKIRPVIRYLETKFLHMYEPEKHLALDETLLKMRARLGIIQYNPKKRARFGVKIYKVCESSSGYCSVFKIYVGSDKVDDLLASESVVLDLMEPFFNKGYIVYLDNWYSSPLLYTKLLELDTYAVGTALAVRKCMPRVFLGTSLQTGEAIRRSGRGVLAIKWKDRKDVHMLTTLHEDIAMETSKILQRGNSEVEVKKPRSVIEYNHGMLGVDRQDQVLSSFPIMRRTIKAYKKLFFYLVDMAIFNSYCIHKKITKKSMHFTDFRFNLVEQLLQTATLPSRLSPGRAPHSDNPLRLQAKSWGHFLIPIPPTACKSNPTRACKVCKVHKKRSETRYMCEKCEIPLHLENCFKEYHTKVNY